MERRPDTVTINLSPAFFALFPHVMEPWLRPIYNQIKFYLELSYNSNEPDQMLIYKEIIDELIQEGADLVLDHLADCDWQTW
jgi:hypothetical protein